MLLIGVAAFIIVLWGARYFLRIARIGAAYKAKALCSALFVSKLDIDSDRAPEVSAEVYWLMRLFPARVDRSVPSVTTSFFGLCSRTAVYREGFGASLGAVRTNAPPPPTLPALDLARPWPFGEGPVLPPSPAIQRVVDVAFSEPDPCRLRRTRAIAVVHAGRLIAEGYAPGITATTPLNGWSVSKGVMGALIGMLIEDGLLRREETRLLREWASPGDKRAYISLEDLLRMRSGLRFSEVYSDPLSDVTRMLFDCPDAGGFAASHPLDHSPGEHWQYASGTTNILSLIARRALGEVAYAFWPRRALFDPLGMRSAVFETDASGTFIGSSFLFATARDWARFGLLMLQEGQWGEGQIVPSAWVKAMTTPTPQSTDGRYGAHWWLKLSRELGGETDAAKKIPTDAYHALGHEGQCLTVIPSRDLVVVRLGLSIDITAWDHAAFLADLLDAG